MIDTRYKPSSGGLNMSESTEEKRKNRLAEINNEVILLVCRGISNKRIVVSYEGNDILNEVSIKVDGNVVKIFKSIKGDA